MCLVDAVIHKVSGLGGRGCLPEMPHNVVTFCVRIFGHMGNNESETGLFEKNLFLLLVLIVI